MLVLGINAYHGDSSSCLVEDGHIVAAAEEERFTRVKHWAGFPEASIRWCLSLRNAKLSDLDAVAINRDTRANLLQKVAYTLKARPDPALIRSRLNNAQKATSVAAALGRAFPKQRLRASVVHVEHHLCHMASAFLVSPFSDAAVVSVDGFGDFASAAWGIGSGTQIRIDQRVHFPHSLGIFYQAITQYLGFHNYGDEYKVMGLAPYGEPLFLEPMRRLVKLLPGGAFELDLLYFLHATQNVAHTWDGGAPVVGQLYGKALEDLLGPARSPDEPLERRHHDIARSAQAMYEEALFHLLVALHARHPVDSLALAGGCAMNSVANGKIARQTPFKHVYVQAAAGDAGGALGAALWAGTRRSSGARPPPMEHAYWGPQYSRQELAELLDARMGDLQQESCSVALVEEEGSLCSQIAEVIASGNVVGWFQGAMEWGPRALGNRSILCDPRRADMKQILNAKIKRRESFRPFAPSVLRERAGEWFEEDADVPFMMKVFQIREHRRAAVPAVTHVDGSGRLQTVTRGTNPRYHALIEAFDKLTGVPMVLNTSFNENEPIVCQPSEALDCFLRTKMDVLVLENYVVRRG